MKCGTHKRVNIGDKGQRFEVRCNGFPHVDRWGVVGWADDEAGANKMLDAVLLHPNAVEGRLFDRHAGKEYVLHINYPSKR